jgi:hypothetical protein
VNSDRVTTDAPIQADKIVMIDRQHNIACFLPANGSVDGSVSCGVISLD